MNFIKRYFNKRYISENKKVRNPQVVSLRDAKNVGILCNITTEDTYKDIYAVFSRLQTADRAVWLMGYIDDKQVPFYCLQQLSADYFCNKDLNWYGKPEKVQIRDFANTEFDILIDFSHDVFDPLRLIMNLSPAKFIVGSEKRNVDCYDLLIQTEKEISNIELLKNITHYTNQLSGKQS
ncbi:MAG: hypothetical protein MJZ70_00400 [Bacteroidales bacterium]|nr:hypothetical protein [Bacteroidales bacterium]